MLTINDNPTTIPMFLSSVPAGFPSPADDYVDRKLDLNEYLIKHPAATYFFRVSGQSLEPIGVFDGDLLIVDRAEQPKHHSLVLAIVDGEYICRIVDLRNRQLLAPNSCAPAIPVSDGSDMTIEGVVTHSIRHHVRPG